MEIAGLGAWRGFAQDGGQALHARNAQYVDVVVAAESLDEGEVDLQGDVTFVLLIGGQQAQHHAVGVPAGARGV